MHCVDAAKQFKLGGLCEETWNPCTTGKGRLVPFGWYHFLSNLAESFSIRLVCQQHVYFMMHMRLSSTLLLMVVSIYSVVNMSGKRFGLLCAWLHIPLQR